MVAPPFPDNEGDDWESAIIREVLTHGRGLLAQQLTNLLLRRMESELLGHRQWIRHRLDYIAAFRPFHAPSHPDSPQYAAHTALYPPFPHRK